MSIYTTPEQELYSHCKRPPAAGGGRPKGSKNKPKEPMPEDAPSCAICEKQFRTLMGLARHVGIVHQLKTQVYYDEYIKTPEEGFCVICGSPTKYKSWGYFATCNHTCGGIYHRQNLAADDEKQAAYLEKRREIKKQEWLNKSEEKKKEFSQKISKANRRRIAKMTKEERVENFSRYSRCDEATIKRLNRIGRNQCLQNWKQGKSGYVARMKGRFRPSHPEKYDGDPTLIIYRSSLEFRMCKYLDSNSGVLKWSSEETIVPYYDPVKQKWRRYFPDFLVTTKHGTTMIEVKPLKETSAPTGTMHSDGRKNRRLLKEQLTYATNCAKWESAKEYCADRKWEFKIITEKDLGGW